MSSSPPTQTHFREPASHVASSEPPSPPAKDLPAIPRPSLQGGDPLDDLVAAVDNAMDDMGLIATKDKPSHHVTQPHWNGKEGPSPPEKLTMGLHRTDSSSSFGADSYTHQPTAGIVDSSRSSSHESAVARSNTMTVTKMYTPPSTGGSDQDHSSGHSAKLSAIRKRTSSFSMSGYSFQRVHSQPDENPSPKPLSTQPLPSPPPEKSKRLVRKVVGWPQAMDFQDVLKMRTALDRAAGYAEKINELAAEDCGLQAWVFVHHQNKRGMRVDIMA